MRVRGGGGEVGGGGCRITRRARPGRRRRAGPVGRRGAVPQSPSTRTVSTAPAGSPRWRAGRRARRGGGAARLRCPAA